MDNLICWSSLDRQVRTAIVSISIIPRPTPKYNMTHIVHTHSRCKLKKQTQPRSVYMLTKYGDDKQQRIHLLSLNMYKRRHDSTYVYILGTPIKTNSLKKTCYSIQIRTFEYFYRLIKQKSQTRKILSCTVNNRTVRERTKYISCIQSFKTEKNDAGRRRIGQAEI